MPDPISNSKEQPLAAIACGGTGGHLFPGIAVGEKLLERGWRVMLLISPKDVDQQAVKSVSGMQVETLPAVGLTRKGVVSFAVGFAKSYFKSRALFQRQKPDAVLAMGGFTSAPPVLAGKRRGAKTFLHEANTIPGRANRWLGRFVDTAFVYFPETAPRIKAREVQVAGMPVRPQFMEPIDSKSARIALGLEADTPTLLVMGGSQGALRVNDLVLGALPGLKNENLQVLHLTGTRDFEKVKRSYADGNFRGTVRAFLTEMDLALAAATVAVSRAGASSLAELAARQLPAVLIPYPAAADNHQFYNARAFVEAGAAEMLEQSGATSQRLASMVLELSRDMARRCAMQQALAWWHKPNAAAGIAQYIARSVGRAEKIGNGELALDPRGQAS